MFFFSSGRRHTRYIGDWSSDVCSSDLDLSDGPREVRALRYLAEPISALRRVVREIIEFVANQPRREDQLPARRAHGEHLRCRAIGCNAGSRRREDEVVRPRYKEISPGEMRRVEPQDGRDRREEVDALRQTGAPARRDPRSGDHERNPYRFVVELGTVLQATMLLEFLAMIGGDDEDG